jgi:RNA polymerase sigma factor (sigma-70 family)
MVSSTASGAPSAAAPARDDPSTFRRDALLKCCLRWTRGDLSEAEDLLGDAYLRVMEAAQQRPCELRKPRSFWLTVINNLGRDRLRRTRRWRTEGDEDAALESLEARGRSAEDLVLLRECLAEAARGLTRLTQRQRSALLLRSSGAEYAEIATLLATSEMNARKLVETARQLLVVARTARKLRRRSSRLENLNES